MTEHIVKVLETANVTHDVKRFVVEKPKGYKFVPGQATDVSINLPKWKNELRPFTFTSLNEWDFLEFTIKIYKDHSGVTDMLGRISAGDEIILHEVFGAIEYKGKGIFIAGGAGITPFISILRELYKSNKQLDGNKLFYSNKTAVDVILEEELQKILKQNFIKLFTRENTMGNPKRRIDRKFLAENISDFSQHFYVCGPDEFVKEIAQHLTELGASPDTVIFEK